MNNYPAQNEHRQTGKPNGMPVYINNKNILLEWKIFRRVTHCGGIAATHSFRITIPL